MKSVLIVPNRESILMITMPSFALPVIYGSTLLVAIKLVITAKTDQINRSIKYYRVSPINVPLLDNSAIYLKPFKVQ